jgi:Domain of Unknown Function with PDB structure (DUF3857)
MDNEQTQIVSQGVTLAPMPSWVDLPALAIPATVDERFVSAGVHVIMSQSQVSLLDAVPAEFIHRAAKVVDISGAEHVARFTAEFDPSDERVEIHFIRIHRNGEVLTRGAASDFEVIRRERNLEMRRFDGHLTVLLEVNDVRVGDVLETAWTVYGQPVALNGLYAAWRTFEWEGGGPLETRFRLLAPSSRPINTKTFGGAAPNYTVTEADNVLDRRWAVKGREGRRAEPLAPPWLFQMTQLQITEWRTWGEVSENFRGCYEEDAPLPEELGAECDRLLSLPTDEERAAGLLRFVQDQLRYLAISMGPGGFVPRPLAAIWETRYGDCKDVTKLYVHMARRLGLNAVPALVHTGIGELLGDVLPTGAAFNHALIRLQINEAVYWLDATMPTQPSPLSTLCKAAYGYALPLRPGAEALEAMPGEPFLTLLDSEETVDLPHKVADKADYRFRMTFRGWRAEGMRSEIARQGESSVFSRYEERLRSTWPDATLRERAVSDDTQANAITLSMGFDVASPWQEIGAGTVRFSTHDLVLAGFLAPMEPSPVHLPIYLGAIGRTARRITVNLPVNWTAPPWEQEEIDDAIGLSMRFSAQGLRQFTLEQEVKIRKATLPPEQADKYRQIVKELRATDVKFDSLAKKGKVLATTSDGVGGMSWLWWTLGALWLGLIVVGALSSG